MDRGTLPQLKILVNCTAVPVTPDKNFKATEDFMEKIQACTSDFYERGGI